MTEKRTIDLVLLGPVEALVDGRRVVLGGDRQRALAAILALSPGVLVSRERLIDELWGEDPPARAEQSLQMQISRLRRALAQAGAPVDRLETGAGGYRLHLEPGERDLDRWLGALERARQQRGSGDHAAARRSLLEGLAAWNGRPLDGVGGSPLLAAERARLEETRLAAMVDRLELDVALGYGVEAIPELEALIAEHPFQERLRGLLMLALYRSGRQADALAAYRDARGRLVEELGIEPGSELRELERRILRHDPALTAPTAARVTAPASAPAERACPACGEDVDASARFCSRCGAALVAEPVAEERKVVTVLACGFAGGSVGHDPEERRVSLAPARAAAERAIEGHGGTLEHFAGDTVVGVFGAPRVREDDAERAVRAAIAARDALAAAGQGPARLAVETGEALVTLARRPPAGRPVVAGEVVDRCLRLEQVARAGEVTVGEDTQAWTRRAIEYGPPELLPMPRSEGPRRVFVARRPVGGFGVYVSEAAAPLVGREDELALLCRLHTRSVRDLCAHLATLVASPGVGKTRLVSELRRRLDADLTPHTWAQGRCIPYGDGVAFWALSEVVKGQAGILESDPAETVRSKLSRSVEPLVRDRAEREWLEVRLAPLVGLPAPEVETAEAIAAWRRYLEALAVQRPLTLVFEDLHWADAGFVDFVGGLAKAATGVSMLVVCTARPEFLERHPGWGGGNRNATTLTVAPLSDEETALLVHELLGRGPLDAGLQAALIDRSGGNPLYAIEFARMVAEDPDAVEELPETVQALIAARIDSLSSTEKNVLQAAAVVGKVFWTGTVAAITGVPASDVEDRLRALVRRDLLRPARRSSAKDQAEFAFSHILIRDVAYAQIPRAARFAMHRAAAAWLEQLTGDRVSTYADVLAHHYEHALALVGAAGAEEQADELATAASRFEAIAGDRASIVDPRHADELYRRALARLREDDPARGPLLARLGDVAFRARSFAEGERQLETAVAVLRRDGRPVEAGAAIVRLAYVVRGRGETGRAAQLAEEAVELLEAHAPDSELARAYAQVAVERFFAGRSQECVRWSERALALADRLGARELRVRPLQLRGMARCELGDTGGLDDLHEALRLGLDLGLGLEAAQSYGNLAIWVWRTEGPEPALELNTTAVDFCRRKGIASWVGWVRAESVWMLYDLGRWDDVLSIAEEAEAWAASGGARYPVATARPYALMTLAQRFDLARAGALAVDVLREAREVRDSLILAPALAAAALTASRAGDTRRGADLAAELLTVMNGQPTYQADHLPALSEVLLAAGDAGRLSAVVEALDALDLPAARHRHALAGSRGALAEHAGDAGAALAGYRDAADGWQAFGNRLEWARAVAGCARTLEELGQRNEAQEARALAERLLLELGVPPKTTVRRREVQRPTKR